VVKLNRAHRHADRLQDRLSLSDAGDDAGFVEVVEHANADPETPNGIFGFGLRTLRAKA